MVPIVTLGMAAYFALIIYMGDVLAPTLLLCGAIAIFWLALRPKRLVYVLVVYSFVVKYLVDDLGVPGVANYLCDGLLILSLVLALLRGKDSLRSALLVPVGVALLFFWVAATLSAVLNGTSLVLYVWAIRNTFRLFGIVYCCVRLLDRADVLTLVHVIVLFFVVNLVVCSYQYFVLGLGQDNVNGIFGTGSGGNAMTNLCLYTVTAFALFAYTSRRTPVFAPLGAIAACCYIASIAEIKVYFVELVLLMAVLVLVERHSFKTLAIVAACAVALLVGTQLLVYFNPGFADYFTLESIIESSSEGGYSNANNLNRLTAVSTLDGMFMGSGLEKALGLGFGAGQYTQYFQSPLYALWGETLNWNWFTDASVFLETGYVGLAFYAVTYMVLTIQSVRAAHLAGGEGWVCRSSAAVSVLCLLLIVYNCTLTVDPGCYFAGLLLSFPFLLTAEAPGSSYHSRRRVRREATPR